jgi:hypothetical protein
MLQYSYAFLIPLIINNAKMYQKDYILRMIEMAAKMLAAILGQIKGGELYKASEGLENLYYDILKEDAAFFRGIPVDQLTEKLLNDHNYTNGHLEILAELFNAEAELCFANKDIPGTIGYSDKSLRLMEFIDKEYKTYSQERLEKMEEVRRRLKALGSRQ